MSNEELVLQKVKKKLNDGDMVNKIENPALKDVFDSVRAINKSDELQGVYTKHSAHTKTSTKGCVMGCLGG